MFLASSLATNTKDAFHSVLEETRDPQFLYTAPAYVSLVRLATLNGTVPLKSSYQKSESITFSFFLISSMGLHFFALASTFPSVV